MKKPVMHSIWLVLVLSILSSSVRAGTLGDLTYEIAQPQLTITDCNESAAGELVIPAEIEGLPVTGIGDEAFYYCSSLTSISIPEGVTSIGDSAFSYCRSLTSITIPEGVTRIMDEAFSSCESLTSITIPDSVISIGDEAFSECISLTPITIPNSVYSIGDKAFASCYSLTSISIPETVTSIGDEAFRGCFALESVVVPTAFYSRAEAHRIGWYGLWELWGTSGYRTHSNTTQPPTTPTIQPSIRMAPVIMVQGEEGSVKTIEVADSPDGPWRFWMDVTATASGVAITDLDGQAHKRFYRVRD